MTGAVTLPGARLPGIAATLRRILGWVAPLRAEQPLARAAVGLSLAITLGFLPFETLVFTAAVGPLTVTDLEAVALLTSLLWVLALVAERRRPTIPPLALACLAALGAVSLASAVLSGTLAGDAIRFTARSALFWVLFLVAADVVRTEATARRLVAWLVAGATISALVGWIAWIAGSDAGLPGAGRTFTVGGVARIAGTFDYPNTAAMAWEATLLVGLPLLVRDARRVRRLALALALAVIAGALLFTISRGALLGVGAGLAVLVVVAVTTRARLMGVVAIATGVLLGAGAITLQLASSLPLGRIISEADASLYGATYEAPARIALAPGSHQIIPVTVTNTGLGTWRPDGPDAYHLSYHWLDATTRAEQPLPGERTLLPGPVEPGERATVGASVVAPAAPGDYLLAWDLVQEHVVWFSEKSVATAMTAVSVSEDVVPDVPPIDGDSHAPSSELYPDLVPVPGRGQLWDAALRMLRDHPLLGVGPGTFRLTYGTYLGWPRWDTDIHSNDLYLELAATTGLAGLVTFLLLLAAAVRPQIRALARSAGLDRASIAVRAGLIAAVVAFLVHEIVDYFLGFSPTGILFWVLLGVGLGVALGAVGMIASDAPGESAA